MSVAEEMSPGMDPVESFYMGSGLNPSQVVSEMTDNYPPAFAEADVPPSSQPEVGFEPEVLEQPELDPERAEPVHDLGSFAAVATRAAERAAEAGDGDVEQADRSKEVFQLEWDKESFEVGVDSKLTLEDYKRETPPEVWDLLVEYMDELKGKEISFVNPTMQGGGVAIMRPAFVHLINLFGKEQENNGAEKGVRAHWFKMADHKELEELGIADIDNPFLFTKQMHNINQRRQMPEGKERIDDEGKALHRRWGDANWEVLGRQDGFVNADIVVIDDPQPVPLISKLREANPDQLIFWRNHIDTNHKEGELMEDPSTPQGEVWQYLYQGGVELVDGTFVHPVKGENPDDNPAKGNAYGPELENTWVAPAVLELNDDLNRELSEEEQEEGFNFINSEIEDKNRLLRVRGEYNKVQELVDPDRDIILLVARFDESKGMDHAVRLGAMTRAEMREKMEAMSYEERAELLMRKRGDQLREKTKEQLANRYEDQGISDSELNSLVEAELTKRVGRMIEDGLDLPQVVIIGNGSVDDPSGATMLKKIYDEQNGLEDPEDRRDTIVMRLKHNYQAINAIMYKSKLLMQTSEAEGMETRISDGIRHGLYATVFNNGGMSTQIVEGRSGEVLDFRKPDHDLPRGAEVMAGLLLDPDELAKKRQSTLEEFDRFNRTDFAIPMGLLRFARAFVTKSKDRSAKADGIWLHEDIIDFEKARAATEDSEDQAA